MTWCALIYSRTRREGPVALGTYNLDFIDILSFWHHIGFVDIDGVLECVWDIFEGKFTLAISGEISVCRSIYLSTNCCSSASRLACVGF